MRPATVLAALAASLAPASLASAGFIAHFSNGRQIWTSTDSGATFTHSGNVTSVSGSGSTLTSIGIVGLGYHAGTATYYATASDSWLYKITGLGTASVAITGVRNLGGDTISFDFFGDTFRGVRGNDLIEMNILAPAAPTVVNAAIGVPSVPATARIGTSDYFGTTTDGAFFKINSVGSITAIGNTGQAGFNMAGGSSNNGANFYASMGRVISGANNDIVRFGQINTANANFTLVSTTNIGASAGNMGMVVVDSVIPLPTAGGLGMAGFGVLAARRRRR